MEAKILLISYLQLNKPQINLLTDQVNAQFRIRINQKQASAKKDLQMGQWDHVLEGSKWYRG